MQAMTRAWGPRQRRHRARRPALESLLQLTGPVEVPTIAGPITAGNVADVILHQQYTQYPAGGRPSRAARQHLCRGAGRGRSDATRTRGSGGLRRGAGQRRGRAPPSGLGQNPSRDVRALGASGEIDTAQADRTFHVAVENSTATKLDYYVRVSVAAHVRITSDGDAAVSTAVTVKNDTPIGLAPNYQIGPDGINSHTPGQYVARVLLWSPHGSRPGRGQRFRARAQSEPRSVLPQRSQTILFTTVIHHAVKNGEVAWLHPAASGPGVARRRSQCTRLDGRRCRPPAPGPGRHDPVHLDTASLGGRCATRALAQARASVGAARLQPRTLGRRQPVGYSH